MRRCHFLSFYRSVGCVDGLRAGGRAPGRPDGRHCTAGQSCYIPLGRHLVFDINDDVTKNIEHEQVVKEFRQKGRVARCARYQELHDLFHCMPLLTMELYRLLRTPQQRLLMLFNGPENPRKLPPPWAISTVSNTWFLGPHESAAETASVQQFLHSTSD